MEQDIPGLLPSIFDLLRVILGNVNRKNQLRMLLLLFIAIIVYLFKIDW